MTDLKNLTFVALDTETTSLFPLSGKLVELSAVKFNLKDEQEEVFDNLINPKESIPEEVSQIHGITDEMVKDKPGVEKVIPEFIQFIGEAETVLLAHNACFDMAFLGMELARLKIPDPGHRCLDTLLLIRNTFPELNKYDLPSLAAHFRIKPEKFHRALADSRTVKELFLKVIQEKKIKNLEELSSLTQVFRFSDTATFEVELPPGFEIFAQAIENSQPIIMIYEGGTKGLQPRKITPLSLLKVYEKIYVLAYCHIDKMQKSFRLDRILEFQIAD